MENTDLSYMARAMRIAEKGRYSTHPNPPVGCVLVRHGEIVGEGYHVQAGYGHAEANALTASGDRSHGATAYVTLEPCSFHGRTPSCAKSLVESGVSRVVIATLDPDPRNAGNGVRILEEAGIEVTVPLLEGSARSLIPGHVKRTEVGMPYVRLKLAMSLDGKTALANGQSKWITSKEARADVQKLRAKSSALVTGVQTVINDNPMMTVRADEIDVEHKEIAAAVIRPVYVLDSGLRIPNQAQLLQRDETVVVCLNKTDSTGFRGQVLKLPENQNRVDLKALLAELAVREHSEVLFECGATLAGALVQARLVDELVIYVAPSLMGGSARSLLNLPEIDRMSGLVSLVIDDVTKIGDDFRINASLN